MKTNTIITISRECGSGGREIGMKLAKKFGIPYYDKELLKEAAKHSGLCEEIFENFDEKPTNSFLYSIVMDPYSFGYHNGALNMPLNHKVFLAAFDTIKSIAENGPCVFIGRCADYALSELPNCINLFIHAPMDFRANRIAKEHHLKEEQAISFIHKKDKQRASYYNYYSTKKWGDMSSYDLCIDSSILGIDGTVDLIEQYLSIFEQKK